MEKSNGYEAVLNKIAQDAQRKNPPNEADYIGEDGLLHCAICKKPKQFRLNLTDRTITVPVSCDCVKREEELNELRKRKQRVEQLKRNSLMDDKYKKCSFDSVAESVENREQIAKCRRYAENFSEMYRRNQGLLLYGGVGTGKTLLSCCIANYLMESLVSVYTTSSVKILKDSRGFKSEMDAEEYAEKIERARLFILDDLGAERGTDYALEIVYDIIDGRYRSGRPMIVTTNLTLEEMNGCSDRRYKRIYDRVLELCYPIEFTGVSWRMKAAAKRYDEMSKLLEGKA